MRRVLPSEGARLARALGIAAASLALAAAALLIGACDDCERCACDVAGAPDTAGAADGGDTRDAAGAADSISGDVHDAAPPDASPDVRPADGGDPDVAAPAVPVLPAPSAQCWDDEHAAGMCSTCNGGRDCRLDLACLDDDGDAGTPRVCTRVCVTDSECGPTARCHRAGPGAEGVCRCEGCGELSVRPGVSCIGSGPGTEWRHPADGRWHAVYEIPDEYATATWGSNPIVPICWSSWVWTASPPDNEAWWTMPDGTWCRRFRRRFVFPDGARACLAVSADDRVQVRLNDRIVAEHAEGPAGGPGHVTGVALLPEPGETNELEFCVCSTAPSYGGLLFNLHYR